MTPVTVQDRPPGRARYCGPCGTIHAAGTCPALRRSSQAARPSSTARGYGAGWRKLRARVLAEEPTCRLCGEPSVDVDHIIPHVPGQPHRRANLRGLCHPCHARRTVRETNGGRRAAWRSQPMDPPPAPLHPPPCPDVATFQAHSFEHYRVVTGWRCRACEGAPALADPPAMTPAVEPHGEAPA